MRDSSETSSSDAETPNGGIVVRSIAPDPETAEHDFLALVAELDDRPIEELPSLYHEVDHFVETVFRTPPSPEHR